MHQRDQDSRLRRHQCQIPNATAEVHRHDTTSSGATRLNFLALAINARDNAARARHSPLDELRGAIYRLARRVRFDRQHARETIVAFSDVVFDAKDVHGVPSVFTAALGFVVHFSGSQRVAETDFLAATKVHQACKQVNDECQQFVV